MNDDAIERFLLRDTIEITLTVDLEVARVIDDDAMERVLGVAAREAVRQEIEEQDDDE